MWGASRVEATKCSGFETAPPDEAAAKEEERGLEVADGDELEAREGAREEGEDADADGAVAATRTTPKMKTVARTVLMLGGMALCPKVDTLQSQVCACVCSCYC